MTESLGDLTYQQAKERGWGDMYSAYQALKEANTSEVATSLGSKEEVRRHLLQLLEK